MNIYHWIAVIGVLDLVLIMFVYNASERREHTPKREAQWTPQ